jgi:heat shock protein HslJ
MTGEQYELNNDPGEEPKGNSTNMALIIGLVIAVLAVIALVVFIMNGQDGGSGGEGESTPIATATDAGGGEEGPAGMVIPTPLPGSPSFTVVASDGANVRSGPNTDQAIIGTLAPGTAGQVTGITQDGTWLQILAPQAPNSQGWVSAGLVQVENMGNVPVIPPPDGPTPTPLPEALLLFTVDQSPIAQGECTNLRWKVENVSEVYVYAQGDRWQNNPVAGEGSQEVCPVETTVYEMRVVQTDGNVVTQQVVVEVIPEVAENPLAGTNWQLASFSGNQAMLPGTTITLSFDDAGSVAGNGGCNDYNGAYTVNGDQLTVGPLATTQQICEEDVMAQETLYIFALPEVATYVVDSSQLILYNAEGSEILRYNRIG